MIAAPFDAFDDEFWADSMSSILGFAIEELMLGETHLVATENVAPDEFIASETIGEVIEKLVILHIRMWHLEDMIGQTDDLERKGELHLKLEHCFKVKRPRLVVVLNAMLKAACEGDLSVVRDKDVKEYKGWQDTQSKA